MVMEHGSNAGDRHDAANALRAVYQHDSNHLVSRGLSEARPDDGAVIGAYTLRSRVDDRLAQNCGASPLVAA